MISYPQGKVLAQTLSLLAQSGNSKSREQEFSGAKFHRQPRMPNIMEEMVDSALAEPNTLDNLTSPK